MQAVFEFPSLAIEVNTIPQLLHHGHFYWPQSLATVGWHPYPLWCCSCGSISNILVKQKHWDLCTGKQPCLHRHSHRLPRQPRCGGWASRQLYHPGNLPTPAQVSPRTSWTGGTSPHWTSPGYSKHCPWHWSVAILLAVWSIPIKTHQIMWHASATVYLGEWWQRHHRVQW